MTPRKVMVYTAAALLVVGLALLLLKIRSILIILVLAITLAAAIRPAVERLRRYGFSQGQAILSIYAGLLLALGIGGYLLIPTLAAQGNELIDEIPIILADLSRQAAQSDNEFLRTSGSRALHRLSTAYIEFRSNPSIEGSTAIRYATSLATAVFGIFTTFVITYYWMTERAIIKRVLLSQVPLNRRDRAHIIWDDIEFRLGGWVRGQLILSLVIGVLSAIGYYLIGLDFWLALAIIAGITEIIPFLGPIIAGAAATLVALTDSFEKALIVVGFVFLLQQLEGAVLVPRVMKGAVGLSPLSVVVAVLVGGAVLGPFGAVLAIPVAAAIQVLVSQVLEAHDDLADTELAATAAGRALEKVGDASADLQRPASVPGDGSQQST